MSAALGISIVALAVACVGFFRNTATDQRDLFLNVHARLLEPELVNARRKVLYERVTEADDVNELHDDEKSALFRLFATYDLLGLYVKQGWLPLRLVLLEWSESLERSKVPGAAMIEWRKRKVTNAWPHYQWLVEQAETRRPREPRWRLFRFWRTPKR